ncbi:hypothetical protein DYH09_28450 [bacterium CPR1]|nr:hypothetical protein [bacterium CPR1]
MKVHFTLLLLIGLLTSLALAGTVHIRGLSFEVPPGYEPGLLNRKDPQGKLHHWKQGPEKGITLLLLDAVRKGEYERRLSNGAVAVTVPGAKHACTWTEKLGSATFFHIRVFGPVYEYDIQVKGDDALAVGARVLKTVRVE